jgi:lipopolysaccharide-induced tumor necrosis factor-alpha factor
MSDPGAPPPNYGAVVGQPQAGAPSDGTSGGPSYPQPGAPPVAPYPTEPPPQYEPSKDYPPQQGAYPPQQGVHPPAGAYPQQAAYPPVGGTYPPQGQPGQMGYQTVPIGLQQQTVIVRNMQWGPHAQVTQCMYCHATVTTSIGHQPGGVTWLAAGLICIVGCWLGCCLIPFCVPDLQDVEHNCPNCSKLLGVHRRL